jgi:hypothetical protein
MDEDRRDFENRFNNALKAELQRVLDEEQERQGPPTEFDPRACLAALALTVGTWIGIFALLGRMI